MGDIMDKAADRLDQTRSLAEPQKRAEPPKLEGPLEIARSEANILAWMEYLPQDCIDTMIRLGWDVST